MESTKTPKSLGTTDCYLCENYVTETAPRRRITPEEAGEDFKWLKNVWFADAECVLCKAKYIAWIAIPLDHFAGGPEKICKLSFRSTFSDIPDPDDLPAIYNKARLERKLAQNHSWMELNSLIVKLFK